MTNSAQAKDAGDKFERSVDLIGELISPEMAAELRRNGAPGKFGSQFLRHVMEQCFADVWPREGLSRRDRSLLTLGILIALRSHGEISSHVRIGVSNGLKPKDFEEILIHASAYAGVPASVSASGIVAKTLQEMGLA